MSRRIRLVEIIGSLHIGGAEKVVLNLARGLDRSRFDLTVLCTRQRGVLAEQLTSEGIDVQLVAPVRARWRYATPLVLWRAIRRVRADIVHSHGTPAMLHTAPVAALHLLPTWVHTFHFGNYDGGLTREMTMERRLCRYPAQLIAVSETQRQSLIRQYGIAPDRLQTIVNGVPPNPHLADPAVRARKRAELGVRADEILVGSIAVLSEQKGIPFLLDAAERALGADPRLRLVVVGGGPHEAALRQRAEALSQRTRITFTGWRQDSQELMTALDVFVMSSLWEAMPMVLLEAMATRRAIVATDVGENRRILDDGRCGVVVPPRDAEALARALLDVAADPAATEAMAARAAARYDSTYTIRRMVEAHEALFTRLA